MTNLNSFSERAIFVMKKIPPGRVLSYGAVAALAGNPRGARQVSWLINSSTKKHNIPWFRIINSKGKISIIQPEGYESQKRLLEEEGIEFASDDSVDLKRYLWDISSIEEIG